MSDEKLNVLLVCTGNTCRSSMAGALLKKIAGEDEVRVTSAGTAAFEGMGASQGAIQALEEKGIDLKAHRARRLTPEMVAAADLVLTMERKHKKLVLDLVPPAREKVFTLKEFAGAPGGMPEDIADPFGGSLEVYRSTAEEIEKFLKLAHEKLKDWRRKARTKEGKDRDVEK